MNIQSGKTYKWITAIFFGSSRGIKDVIVLTIPQVVSVGTAFVTSIFLARFLGPAELGKYALVLSVSGLAISLSDLGIGQTAIRYSSRAFAQSDHQTQFQLLRWAFRLRLSITMLVSIALYFLSPALGDTIWRVPGLSGLLQLGLLLGVVNALSSAPILYFQSIRRFDRNAVVTTGQPLLVLVGILILWWLNLWNVAAVLVVSLIAAAATAVIFLLVVPREIMFESRSWGKKFGRGFRSWIRNPITNGVRSSIPDNTDPGIFALYNLLATVIVMLTMRADVWLMGVFLDQREIGIYNAASRFAIPMTIILGAVTTALWPRASAVRGVEAILELLRKTLRLSVVVAVAAAVYSLGMPLLAPSMFGSEYQGSILLGHILCLRYAFAILVCPIGVVGYSLGLVRIYWVLNLLQLVVVLLVILLLLPILGSLAAAVALLANEVVGAVATGIVMVNRIRHVRKAGHVAQYG